MYYRSAGVVAIVFDVGREKSFEDVKYWVSEVKQKGLPDVVLAIVANKIDCENRLIS